MCVCVYVFDDDTTSEGEDDVLGAIAFLFLLCVLTFPDGRYIIILSSFFLFLRHHSLSGRFVCLLNSLKIK